jgi:4-amino-4-deoxy-L-arabinose transferase-like glycosyltransferase
LNLTTKKIIVLLILVVIISLGLKLYYIDFSIPYNTDNLGFILRAFSHLSGDFNQTPDKGLGWSLFIFPFFNLIESDNLLDYSNLVRIISLAVGSASIPMMYMLGTRFFDRKYSFTAACLFAFEPHLNYYSGIGLAEPLYILAIILTFYFVISNNAKMIIPALMASSIIWWTRINGLVIIMLTTIVFFIVHKRNPENIRFYLLGLGLFFLIISPMLIQRDSQFEDPLYFWYNDKIFVDNYDVLVSSNVENNGSPFNYIEKNGIFSFTERFIFQGITNSVEILSKLLLPYLIILVPIGIFFSLRAFDQKQNLIWANWVFILGNIAILIVVIATVPERRFLLLLYPFLIIFSIIPIQRLVEYGFSTFSFSQKQKNISLFSIIVLVLVLSIGFTVNQYDRPNVIFENEKLEVAHFMTENLDGVVLDGNGPAFEYVSYALVNEPHGNFKDQNVIDPNRYYSEINPNFQRSYIYAESIENLLTIGSDHNLRYIVSNENAGFFHKYVNEIYSNEEKYPYLTKIFDSNEQRMKFIKIKIFEIDYEQFRVP